MKKFDYAVTVVEPFKDIENELNYLHSYGHKGWELVGKDTIGVKKKVSIVMTGNEEAVRMYHKFYWKREHDNGNGELGQRDSEDATAG